MVKCPLSNFATHSINTYKTQPAVKKISLYFHVPFCSKKCDYCHFFVIPDRAPHKEQFIESLKLEWEQKARYLDGVEIATVYFGGGTPTLMGPEFVRFVLEMLKNSDGASFSSDAEVTIEANPESITRAAMRHYREAGINRVSIGVQTLDNQLLKTLGRLHDARRAQEAVSSVFSAGIENISIDLMYDLPFQTLPGWKNTLEQAAELPIKHLSLYNLTIEPHTVFFKKRETLQKSLPSAETSLNMYELAVKLLQDKGLRQYEISAFAKENYFSRHNTGYWTARPFLGYGPSAFSFWEGSRFQNYCSLSKYSRALQDGKAPVGFSETLSPTAQRQELLAVQMRLLQGVDLDSFQKLHGELSLEPLKAIESLEAAQLLQRQGSWVKLTRKGILFYDTVAADLIS